VIIFAQITLEEKEILRSWKRYGSCELVRDRAHAVLLNSQGWSANRVGQALLRPSATIRSWLGEYRERRMSSLFPGYEGNTNASKLTLAQRTEIATVLKQSPSDAGLSRAFWTFIDMKKWVRTEFGVVYESDRSYHFLLHSGRLSWKLPDKFDVRRDDVFVEERIREIRKEITPLLKDENWVVLAGDETRLVWESESRRAWLKTNEKTILKVNRDAQYQSFFGALNFRIKKCHLYQLSWQNQEEIIKALQKLVAYYPGKKICLIWDNARWHKGKLLREELKKGKSLERLHLINLPPYAPDTNPQEHVWKYAKDKTANLQQEGFSKTVNQFKLAVIHRSFNYAF